MASPSLRPFVLAFAFVMLSAAPARGANDCTFPAIGELPLTELGTGTHSGWQGGLYPGGSNVLPPAHAAEGRKRAVSLEPLDAFGLPDDAGRVVLLSVGMSNATQEFSAFKTIADADPHKNPALTIVDGAQPGWDAVDISDAGAFYWSKIDFNLLPAAGVTASQVQVVWLKESRRDHLDAFPDDAVALRDDLKTIVAILHTRYPNLSIVYVTSRIFSYASIPGALYAYRTAFACKWLIEDQIAGDAQLNFDLAHGPVHAPWIAWGPYLWADGVNPRVADGLAWTCDDFQADHTHPGPGAVEKVAAALLSFFRNDATAAPWFLAAGHDADLCGDVDASGTVTAGDALAVLRAAVGGEACLPEPCVCDATGDGTITASDALEILRIAVGLVEAGTCPGCV